MGKFRCKKCNYFFEREIENSARICPNCGMKDSISKEKDAIELLEESE